MSYIAKYDPQVIEYLQALWRKYEETGDIYWCHVGNFRANLYHWELATNIKPVESKRLTKKETASDQTDSRARGVVLANARNNGPKRAAARRPHRVCLE